MARQGHLCAAVNELFTDLRRAGFTVTRRRSGTWQITPPHGGRPYFTHGGEAAIHPLRRALARQYGVRL